MFRVVDKDGTERRHHDAATVFGDIPIGGIDGWVSDELHNAFFAAIPDVVARLNFLTG